MEEIQAGEENQMAGADQAEMTPYPAETAPDQEGTVPVPVSYTHLRCRNCPEGCVPPDRSGF